VSCRLMRDKGRTSAKSQLRRRFHLVSRLSEGPGSFRFRTLPAFTHFSGLTQSKHLKGLTALVLSLLSPSPRQRVMIDPVTMLVFHLHVGKALSICVS
jgi:hypothetical protein